MTGALGSMYFPTSRSILSRTVAPEMLGATLGTIATFESVAAIISPLIFGWVYSVTLETYPVAIFFLGASMAFAAWCVTLYIFIVHRRNSVNRS